MTCCWWIPLPHLEEQRPKLQWTGSMVNATSTFYLSSFCLNWSQTIYLKRRMSSIAKKPLDSSPSLRSRTLWSLKTSIKKEPPGWTQWCQTRTLSRNFSTGIKLLKITLVLSFCPFIPDYDRMVHHMFMTLQKLMKFWWSPNAQCNLETVMEDLSTAVFYTLSTEERHFLLNTAARLFPSLKRRHITLANLVQQ